MLVYAALGATPAGAFEQQAALALTAVVRRPRGALVTADLHQGTTASCEENKLAEHARIIL